MKLKLKEIASLANVSIATVSLVLHNKDGVGKEKREYIQSLLLENGYSLSPMDAVAAKQNLRFLKYCEHGMLVNGNPGFVNAIVDSIEKECRFQRFNLVMTSFDSAHKKQILDLVAQDPLDGIILLGTELPADFIHKILELPVPVVVVDSPCTNINVSCVTMNNDDAVWAAMSHLISLNHEKIGFLANALPSDNCYARFNAYKFYSTTLGKGFDPSLVFYINPTIEGAYSSMLKILESGKKLPSALIANNDSIALGVIRALNEYGIKVPDDVSIIGFDNIPFASVTNPPLTTISVPCAELGIWAVRLLVNYLNFRTAPPTKIMVNTQLITRNSTTTFQPSTNPYILS